MDAYERLTALAKRRGIFYPSYDIYGGVSGFNDFGPLGSRLKRNIEDAWREVYVLGEGFMEIEAPTIAPEAVFRASGHLDEFADVEVTCRACGQTYRADHLLSAVLNGILETFEAEISDLSYFQETQEGQELAQKFRGYLREQKRKLSEEPGPSVVRDILRTSWYNGEIIEGEDQAHYQIGAISLDVDFDDLGYGLDCPECDGRNWEDPHAFNLMFETRIGAGDAEPGYMRPETAQSIFVAYRDLYRFAREQVPFGVVQIGKAYRNEISPRQGVIRLREFHQMEAEVFFDPDDKSHDRFDEVAGVELSLVPNSDPDEVVETTVGEAVDKGLILHEALGYYMGLTKRYLVDLGIDPDRLRFRQHLETEMAHYSRDTWDAEARSERFGWVELVGIADRTDYDLTSHEEEADVEMVHRRELDEAVERTVRRIEPDMAKLGPVFKDRAGAVADALGAIDPDAAGGEIEVEVDGETVEVPDDAYELVEIEERVEVEPVTPHVVEPSYGLDRIFYFALEHAFEADADRGWDVLHLPPALAPVTVGVFPLMTRDGLDDRARELDRRLREAGLHTYYDDSGNIGRRYARQDEVGTPYCVTVDYETLDGDGVTVRDRASTDQVRVPVDELVELLEGLVEGTIAWEAVRDRYPDVERE